ncbi:MAG: T9SS type A sorting domain-containing protein [Ignavibacteriaceae bacterium]|nr:T9SS type A sorting domain-containing protein [Ignavibacteriaceae bacterium]
MRIKYTIALENTSFVILLALFILATTAIHATTYIVQFGGTFGLAYSPNSLNVFVGDTIKWQGDFSMHPLSSTSVPTGAVTFHQGSGSVFSYIVTTPGMYNYQCDFHFSAGMTGSFNALNLTNIKNNRTSFPKGTFRLEQNFPNPFNPTTLISFEIPFQAMVSITVYNLIGQKVATLVNENMTAGSYSKSWNAAAIPSGVYIYRLQAGALAATRKLILIK